MPVIHNQPPGEPFIQIGKHPRMVDTASLTAHQKHLVWAGIKSSNPDLARLLKEDQALVDLKKQFNGTIQLTAADFNRYMQAGLKLEEHTK